MDQLAPWEVRGRYGADEGTEEHQVAHVDFGSIKYIYMRSTGEEVKQVFVVQEATEDCGGVAVVIEASGALPRARP